MAGIFPATPGYEASEADNAYQPATAPLASCPPRFYGRQCAQTIDIAAQNATISELLALVDSFGLPWDCTKLTNLRDALEFRLIPPCPGGDAALDCYELRCINGLVTWQPCVESAQAGSYSNKVFFTATGGIQTWVVPSGVTAIFAKLWGAGGAGVAGAGGAGGWSYATIPVTAGETLSIVVGEGGTYTYYSVSGAPAYSPASYGFAGRGYLYLNGDGPTGNEAYGGGGLTGIFRSTVNQAGARLVAGGGGGVSDQGISPGNGNDPVNAGGVTGSLQGADGSGGGSDSRGGGGGGYEGGLSGTGSPRNGTVAAEGGSGFSHADNSDDAAEHTVEFGSNPPGQSDSDYVQGIGVGGGQQGTYSPYHGGDGLAVIYY